MSVASAIFLSMIVSRTGNFRTKAYLHPPRQSSQTIKQAPISLAFKDFFEPGKGELKPSIALLKLNSKRVRLVGFMAQMEDPPLGAFYLCPHPVFCDEEGGGTADLPPESVLVIVPSAKGKQIPFIGVVLEATGTFEVGSRQEADGRTSSIRLILEGPDVLTSTDGKQTVKSSK